MKKAKAKTSTERVAEYRARHAKAGVVKLELYAPAELHDRIRKYVSRITKQNA